MNKTNYAEYEEEVEKLTVELEKIERRNKNAAKIQKQRRLLQLKKEFSEIVGAINEQITQEVALSEPLDPLVYERINLNRRQHVAFKNSMQLSARILSSGDLAAVTSALPAIDKENIVKAIEEKTQKLNTYLESSAHCTKLIKEVPILLEDLKKLRNFDGGEVMTDMFNANDKENVEVGANKMMKSASESLKDRSGGDKKSKNEEKFGKVCKIIIEEADKEVQKSGSVTSFDDCTFSEGFVTSSPLK